MAEKRIRDFYTLAQSPVCRNASVGSSPAWAQVINKIERFTKSSLPYFEKFARNLHTISS